MPNTSLKLHLGRHERIVLGERQTGFEKPAAVELAVVGDHEHHLPLVDVVVDEADTDVGQVFVVLHLEELAAEEGCGGGGGHCCLFLRREVEVELRFDGLRDGLIDR